MDEDNVDGILSAVKDFEAVNFDYGDNLFTFCRKFEYDWKRDLPDIARLIDMKYMKCREGIEKMGRIFLKQLKGS